MLTYSRSVGIDLAADPRNTAVVELGWDADRLDQIKIWGAGRSAVTDEELIQILDRRDAKIGIDCPLGWPRAFSALMATESTFTTSPVQAGDPAERNEFVWRATDRMVVERTKKATGRAVRPLSVSADRIAHVAFRLAGIRSRLSVNKDAPRDGSEVLVEVYPAAALALWGMEFTNYKGSDEEARVVRSRMVARLELGRWALVEHADTLIASDHVLDAFICALIARDADVYGVQVPPKHQVDAFCEGWIHLPKAPLPYS